MRSNIALFLIPAVIWGSTWMAIRFQLGVAAPEVSIFIRFVVAALGCWLLARLSRIDLRVPLKEHPWLFLMGLFNFCLNYFFTYKSQETVTSGVVALGFSLMVYFNILGIWLFFGRRPAITNVLGALLGGLGLSLIFRREILVLSETSLPWVGILFAITATLMASSGNMVASRFQKHSSPVLAWLTWGMIYGALANLLLALLRGAHWQVPWTSVSYWSSLLYLSIFGTLIAFLCYMELMRRIGAEKAVYTTILSPVIALLLSTLFENYTWSWDNIAGATLALAGQILAVGLGRRRVDRGGAI